MFYLHHYTTEEQIVTCNQRVIVSERTLITLLHNWKLPPVQTAFWDKPESAQRQVIPMDAISYTVARANLAKTMEQVCNNHAPVIITRKRESPVVMMSSCL